MTQMPRRRKNKTSRGWHDPYNRREARADGGFSVSASRRPSHSRRLSPVVLDHFRFFKATVHRTGEFTERAEIGIPVAAVYGGLRLSISGWRTVFIPLPVGISNLTTDWRVVGCEKTGLEFGGAEPLFWICRHGVGRSKFASRCSSERWRKTARISDGPGNPSKKFENR